MFRIVRDPIHILFFYSFVLLSCCSIFNDRCRSSRSDFDIIPHPNHFVNTFFETFFTFLIFFQICYWYPSLLATCDIITRISALVKYIFGVFYPFYAFLAFCPKYIRQKGRLFCRKSKKPSTFAQKHENRPRFFLIIYTRARKEKSKKRFLYN